MIRWAIVQGRWSRAAVLAVCCVVVTPAARAEAPKPRPVRPHPADAQPIQFDGTLEEGCRYRAEVTWDPAFDQWWPVQRIQTALHQGARIEWTNLDAFPAMQFTASARYVVEFEVVGREVVSYPSQRRSAVTWRCRILSARPSSAGRTPG